MKVKIKEDGMILKFKYEEIGMVLKILEEKAEENKANKWPEKEDIKTITSPNYISNICNEINEIAKDEKKDDAKKEKTIKELKHAVAVKNNCKDYEEFEINRKIVKLHDIEKKTFAEIANILDLSYSKVQKRYHQMKGDKDEGVKT